MMNTDIHSASLVTSMADKIDGFFYRCLNDKDFTMVHLSSGFQKTLGYDPAWFIETRQSFAGLTHPDDLAMVDRTVGEAVTAGQNWRVRYRVKTRAGDWRSIFETGGGYRDPATGEIKYLDGVILDNDAVSSGNNATREIAGATQEIIKTLKNLRLLALNARLEAVRAGDHGLGFTVVAREMVDLAERSDQNARLIKAMIAKLEGGDAKAA